MTKKIIILAMLLIVGILISGCASSGYDYDSRQQAPIGGGCGVQAPTGEIDCTVDSGDASFTNVDDISTF